MRKKLYDEFVAECESSCTDMYIAWLEERVFALNTKVEKFTADSTASTPCRFDKMHPFYLLSGQSVCGYCGIKL